MNELNHYILVDHSGSMARDWPETLGSVNGYAKALKNTTEVNNTITLVAFDSNNPFEVLRDAVPLDKWIDITSEELLPRGMTPLYTAVVGIVNLAKSVDNERVVIVVMTDGMDTGNVEHTVHSAKGSIKEAIDKGWEVLFLGANFDAKIHTDAFGLGSDKYINTSTVTRGATMSMMATKSMAYGSSLEATASMNFTSEEQAVAEGKTEQEPGGISDGTTKPV